jgi:hypothetical protein
VAHSFWAVTVCFLSRNTIDSSFKKGAKGAWGTANNFLRSPFLDPTVICQQPRPKDQRPKDQRPKDQRPKDQIPKDQRPKDQKTNTMRQMNIWMPLKCSSPFLLGHHGMLSITKCIRLQVKRGQEGHGEQRTPFCGLHFLILQQLISSQDPKTKDPKIKEPKIRDQHQGTRNIWMPSKRSSPFFGGRHGMLSFTKCNRLQTKEG